MQVLHTKANKLALGLFAVSYASNDILILVLLSLGLALTSGYVPGYNTSIVSFALN